ncbi:MAG: hypothetical protein ISS34_04625 [Candidatus Omnitrophica bacterium]|nr:hypothetical protein [Candidatus Omnitrophota bacterium]
MQRPFYLKKHAGFIGVALIVLIFYALTFYAEKIEINEGLGYDGAAYAKIAKDFQTLFLKKEISPYRLHRVFPSAVIHYGLRLLNLPLDNAHILKGFEIYNLAILLISLFIWSKIAKSVRLTEKSRWFGYLLLFGSFAILKMNFYYPTLTDTTAFALGLGLLYFYIKESSLGILLMLFISFFTWPVAILNAVILYIFPKKIKAVRSRSRLMPKIIASGISLLYLLFFLYFHYLSGYGGGIAVNKGLLPFSVASVLFYLFLMSYLLLRDIKMSSIFTVKNLSVIARRVIFILLLFGVLSAAYSYFVRHPGTGESTLFSIILYRIFITPVIRPLTFLLAHVVYFGPAIIIAAVFFDKISKLTKDWGIGITALLIANLSLAIFAESRGSINIVPFVVFFVVLFIDRVKWDNRIYLGFMVISLILSKVWLGLNADLDFYKMNFGHRIPREWYVIQGLFVSLCFAFCIIARFFYREHTDDREEAGI